MLYLQDHVKSECAIAEFRSTYSRRWKSVEAAIKSTTFITLLVTKNIIGHYCHIKKKSKLVKVT